MPAHGTRGAALPLALPCDERTLAAWLVAMKAARRLGIPVQDRWDVVQESTLRLLRSGSPVIDAEAWIFRVTCIVAREYRERAARFVALDRSSEPTGSSPQPWEQQADLETVLAGLGRRDAELLRLSCAGEDRKTVAERLGVATGSVGSLLTRAKARAAERWKRLAVAAGP